MTISTLREPSSSTAERDSTKGSSPPSSSLVPHTASLDERMREAYEASEHIRRQKEAIAVDVEELMYVHNGFTDTDEGMSTFDGVVYNLLFAFGHIAAGFPRPGELGATFAVDVGPRLNTAAHYLNVLTGLAIEHFDKAPSEAMQFYDPVMDRVKDSLVNLNRATYAYKERIEKSDRYRLYIGPTRFFEGRRLITAKTIPWSTPKHLQIYQEGFQSVYDQTTAAAIDDVRTLFGTMKQRPLP